MFPRLQFAPRLAFVLGLSLIGSAARGDIAVNFDDLSYPNGSYDPNAGSPSGPAPGTGSYDNGWDLNGGFTSHGTFFSNSYDTTYHSWSGWAYSNVNDPTTTGPSPFTTDYDHQFAAITQTAPGGSGNYAIEYGTGGIVNLPSGASPISMLVTNSTSAYLSMTLGDGFAKKFTTGDYLELKIFGYSGLNGNGAQLGEVDFYLANYTSKESLPVHVWALVNLTSLAGSQSLTFDYASSDVGMWGINTPTYFAMDNLTLASTTPEPSSVILALSGLAIVGLFFSRRQRERVPAN